MMAQSKLRIDSGVLFGVPLWSLSSWFPCFVGDSVFGSWRTASTAAVNASGHNHSDERQEEQQDDAKRRLGERVVLRKTLQFGPDVLEDSHHVL